MRGLGLGPETVEIPTVFRPEALIFDLSDFFMPGRWFIPIDNKHFIPFLERK